MSIAEKLTPRWIEIDVTGDETQHRYVGRFCVKPFLTLAEKADARRLAERYCDGITVDPNFQSVLSLAAFLKFYLVDHEADWWKNNGTDLIDSNVIVDIFNKIADLREKLLGSDKAKQEGESVDKNNN